MKFSIFNEKKTKITKNQKYTSEMEDEYIVTISEVVAFVNKITTWPLFNSKNKNRNNEKNINLQISKIVISLNLGSQNKNLGWINHWTGIEFNSAASISILGLLSYCCGV